MRFPCTDCPKTFRFATGLEWHREHNHQVQELPAPEEDPEDNPIESIVPVDDEEQQTPPTTVRVVWNDNSGTYEVKKPSTLDDDDTEQQAAPTTVRVVWNDNSATYEVEKPSTLASPVLTPQVEEPTKPGDYNCLDCRGANQLGGFFLRGAVDHYRQTGHRLEHIPGSYEAALSQLHSFQFLPGPSGLAARSWFSRYPIDPSV